MTRVIAITNQKGGVGKTTTAINVAASLALSGSTVLLVDIDPQGNATVGSGLIIRDLDSSIYELLLGEVTIDETIQTTKGKYHIIPSHPDLSGAQVEMTAMENRDYLLAQKIDLLKGRYDIILIDCPPVLNVLTVNALSAAHEVLIPVQCEYYALEGLASLVETIELVKQNINTQLQILGLVRTMYDRRTSLSVEVSEQLNEHFPNKLFRTVIPRNVRLAEAPSHGLSVLQYDRHCSGTQAYLALAAEILRKISSD